ncbi:MAG: hypothetical protein ACRCW4_14530 [Candidatus Neomicrothrix subdominans]
MPLVPRFIAGIKAVHTAAPPTNDLGAGTAGSVAIEQVVDFSLADGTGAGQADRVFADTRTVNASTNDDLDLAGTLTDSFGGTVTFAKVKGVYIRSSPANSQNFTVGAAPANGLTSLMAATAVVMRPGAVMLVAAGAADATAYGVVAGTGDLLRIANGAGAAVSYDIIIVGTSA